MIGGEILVFGWTLLTYGGISLVFGGILSLFGGDNLTWGKDLLGARLSFYGGILNWGARLLTYGGLLLYYIYLGAWLLITCQQWFNLSLLDSNVAGLHLANLLLDVLDWQGFNIAQEDVGLLDPYLFFQRVHRWTSQRDVSQSQSLHVSFKLWLKSHQRQDQDGRLHILWQDFGFNLIIIIRNMKLAREKSSPEIENLGQLTIWISISF